MQGAVVTPFTNFFLDLLLAKPNQINQNTTNVVNTNQNQTKSKSKKIFTIHRMNINIVIKLQ